jgi:hypothetical protein
MKKSLLIFMAILFYFALLHSQTIDPCGENTGKTIIDGDNALYFNLQGINLNTYNWNNPDVNCHINLMINDYHSTKANKLGAAICLGVGLGLVPAAIVSTITGGEAGGLYVLSALGLGGSIYLYSRAGKSKKSMNYHLNEVSEYYRAEGLNK